MGEALMFRAGGEGTGGGNYTFTTEIIEASQQYTVPTGIKDNQIFVRIFGGGGSGCCRRVEDQFEETYDAKAGGGGGWMNSGFVDVIPGNVIPITIGGGGAMASGYNSHGAAGGTSSFGTYLSASGGTGATWRDNDIYAGNGGAGGGAFAPIYAEMNAYGGIGYQFGGGGASSWQTAQFGTGGSMGGNGANGNSRSNKIVTPAENGINTISIINESDVYNADGIGYGIAGGNTNRYNAGGGGGYGANGGYNCGGGGGYGAAGYGGNGMFNDTAGGGGSYGHGGSWSTSSWIMPTYGGGGYGTCGYRDSTHNSAGASGVCILQYYKKE